MNWCELNHVDYILGLAKNARLSREVAVALEQARTQFQQTHQPTRVFTDFHYQALFQQVYKSLVAPCPIPLRC